MTNRRGHFLGWLDPRSWLGKFYEEQVQGRLAFQHRTNWDYLGYTGTIALALLILQMATGLLLLLYYTPDPDRAFASLQLIRSQVPFGRLFSNLHALNSKLIILLLFVHAARIMLRSAFRGPREPLWYSGALLLVLALLMGFSGYLLPWSQQSFWASTVGAEAFRGLPLVGDGVVRLLRGGDRVTGATLHRFFALHVSLLPILIVSLTWFHVKRVWKLGVIAPPSARAVVDEARCISCEKCVEACEFGAISMAEPNPQASGLAPHVSSLTPQASSEPETRNEKPETQGPHASPLTPQASLLPRILADQCNACRACAGVCPQDCITFASETGPVPLEPLFPHSALHRAKAVLVVLIALVFAVFFLGGIFIGVREPANPLLTPDRVKPEWFFLAAYETLRLAPGKTSALLALAAVSLIVFFLPALDRKGPRDYRRRPLYLFLVGAGIIAFIILTIAGWF